MPFFESLHIHCVNRSIGCTAQEFPSFGGNFEFMEPALPRLVPWGLRKWRELDGGPQSRVPTESGQVSAAVFASVGGIGFVLGALLMLGLGRVKRSSSAMSARHAKSSPALSATALKISST